MTLQATMTGKRIFNKSFVRLAIYALAILVMLLPLTQAEVPPLVDYPNHLAKMHLALNLDSDPHLREFYEWHHRLIPNQALDLIIPPIARLAGLETAMRLFLAAIMVQLVAAVALLRYAVFGRVGWWPLASVLIVYNYPLAWGFLNFVFTCGLALIFFAVWIILSERHWLLRTAVFTPLASLLFFFHLIGLAVFGLCIGGYQLWRIVKAYRNSSGPGRRPWGFILEEMTATAAPFLPVAVFWLLSPTSRGLSSLFSYGPIADRLAVLAAPFLYDASAWDWSLMILVILIAVIGRLFWQATLARELCFPVVILAGLSVLMPQMILDVWATHIRLPVPAAALILAGVRLQPKHSALAVMMVLSALLLFSGRLWHITQDWQNFDRRVEQYRGALSQIAAGSKVIAAIDTGQGGTVRSRGARPSAFHLSAFVVIDASSFDPFLFSDPRIQNFSTRPAYAHLDTFSGARSEPERLKEALNANGPRIHYWSRWWEDFDYYLLFAQAPHTNIAPDKLTLIVKEDWFAIYRIGSGV